MRSAITVDRILRALNRQNVDRDTVALVLEELEASEIELGELRESRLNLAVLAEELRSQAESVAEERDNLLEELRKLEAKFELETRRSEELTKPAQLSPDALMVLKEFGKQPEAVQTFSTLKRLLCAPETTLAEAVNELGRQRLVAFGQDMGRPEEFALTPKGREYFMNHIGKRGSA